MKNKLIAGNWKMNKNRVETQTFFAELLPLITKNTNKVVIFPPFTDLCKAVKSTKDSDVSIGGQNCHWSSHGAFTGEISAEMLVETGATYVLVGHSERRAYFGETDQTVNMRAKSAIGAGLTAVICVGETLAQRQNGQTEQVLRTQTQSALDGISSLDKVVIAYEPVWAIGTGVTASCEEANSAIGFIREVVREKYGNSADDLYVLYGGSMNENNASELLSMPQIDGGLIGGASLDATKFAKIVNFR